jgi:hypothetical protein
LIKWPTSRCGNPVTQIFYRNRFWTGSAAIIYPSHRLSNNRNFEFSVWMYFVIVVGSRESTRYFVFYFYFYGGIDLSLWGARDQLGARAVVEYPANLVHECSVPWPPAWKAVEASTFFSFCLSWYFAEVFPC